jgi:hypothetical protein
MKPYSIDLRKKIVESVRRGISKSETARRCLAAYTPGGERPKNDATVATDPIDRYQCLVDDVKN